MLRHINPARIQSPSSINTYRQCPRKYYYSYVKKLPSKPSIHLIRGNIAHSVLEDFFDQDFNLEEWHIDFHRKIVGLLDDHWARKSKELSELNLNRGDLFFYYNETKKMLLNWANYFQKEFQAELMKTKNLKESFNNLIPVREEEYTSEKYYVRGFIDAISDNEGVITIRDYKTSKNPKISDDYELQLAIYALMYQEKHGVLPNRASIFFLKHYELELPVNQELVDRAKIEIEMIHMKTQSEILGDYPMCPGPLCKWRTGQCDFYDLCFSKNKF